MFPEPTLGVRCPHADVDLRPFILALIDEFNAVQWVAAIGKPDSAVACSTTQPPASTEGSFNLVVEPIVVPIVGPN